MRPQTGAKVAPSTRRRQSALLRPFHHQPVMGDLIGAAIVVVREAAHLRLVLDALFRGHQRPARRVVRLSSPRTSCSNGRL